MMWVMCEVTGLIRHELDRSKFLTISVQGVPKCANHNFFQLWLRILPKNYTIKSECYIETLKSLKRQLNRVPPLYPVFLLQYDNAWPHKSQAMNEPTQYNLDLKFFFTLRTSQIWRLVTIRPKPSSQEESEG